MEKRKSDPDDRGDDDDDNFNIIVAAIGSEVIEARKRYNRG